MNYLKNKTDADDVTQNVLLKFYKSDVDFESEEHVKHWLIRVALNECKNFLRFPWQKYASLEGYMETLQMPVKSGIRKRCGDICGCGFGG